MSKTKEQLEAENDALRGFIAAIQKAADTQAVSLPFLAGFLDLDGGERPSLINDLARALEEKAARKTAGEVSS